MWGKEYHCHARLSNEGDQKTEEIGQQSNGLRVHFSPYAGAGGKGFFGLAARTGRSRKALGSAPWGHQRVDEAAARCRRFAGLLAGPGPGPPGSCPSSVLG